MPASGGPRDLRGRFFADVLTFGWALPAALAAGAGLGWLADRWLGTFPVATLVLGLLGLVAGLRQLLREASSIAGEPPPEEPGAKAPPKGPDGDGP